MCEHNGIDQGVCCADCAYSVCAGCLGWGCMHVWLARVCLAVTGLCLVVPVAGCLAGCGWMTCVGWCRVDVV